MRIRTVAAMCLLVLGLVAPPATATTTAACGTTAAQWLGSFTGTEYLHHESGRSMTVDITSSGGTSLHPETDVGETFYLEARGTIVDGKLNWHDTWWVHSPSGYFQHSHEYTTSSVTCAGGRVTAFDGTVETYGNVSDGLTGTFTLSR